MDNLDVYYDTLEEYQQFSNPSKEVKPAIKLEPKSAIKSEPKSKMHRGKKVNIRGHQGVHKDTHKARFFIDNKSVSGIYGFWLPKSAIVQYDKGEVTYYNWATIKIIEFK